MFKRKGNAAFANGYAFFKLLIGLGWACGAVELFENDSLLGALACGIIAIGFFMESVRLLREKYGRRR